MENNQATFIDYCAMAIVISGFALIGCVLKWGNIYVGSWQAFLPYFVPATSYFEAKALTRTANVFIVIHGISMLSGVICYKWYNQTPAKWNAIVYLIAVFWGWCTILTIGIVILMVILAFLCLAACGGETEEERKKRERRERGCWW